MIKRVTVHYEKVRNPLLRFVSERLRRSGELERLAATLEGYCPTSDLTLVVAAGPRVPREDELTLDLSAILAGVLAARGYGLTPERAAEIQVTGLLAAQLAPLVSRRMWLGPLAARHFQDCLSYPEEPAA
ncbi:MAG: hypothetical protein AB1758_30015 [Candidatus Eremiobacterota bacterium]